MKEKLKNRLNIVKENVKNDGPKYLMGFIMGLNVAMIIFRHKKGA